MKDATIWYWIHFEMWTILEREKKRYTELINSNRSHTGMNKFVVWPFPYERYHQLKLDLSRQTAE